MGAGDGGPDRAQDNPARYAGGGAVRPSLRETMTDLQDYEGLIQLPTSALATRTGSASP